ncbi:MAG: HAD family hydrolase, partial [Rhodospirillaceae bacterium]|nr:HAD family hydrolase [Rhodospirillaceae bacterium]
MDVESWIFDLDNTLYRTSPGMLAQIDDLMGSFISDFLNVDRVEARRIQKGYFRSHGLTLRGLMG